MRKVSGVMAIVYFMRGEEALHSELIMRGEGGAQVEEEVLFKSQSQPPSKGQTPHGNSKYPRVEGVVVIAGSARQLSE